jgi:splicing factor 3B subunit 2
MGRIGTGRRRYCTSSARSICPIIHTFATDEEESESEAESDEDKTAETAPTDGLQTPSGMETPSGMHSVVSTVPGGLETPDFLELRKGRAQSEVSDTGPRSLYQVVPEKQTAVRGLMGSERGYDVAAVAGLGAQVPVLGNERSNKVCFVN